MRGAELAPISSTFGMCSGIGVGSIKTVWLNLRLVQQFGAWMVVH